MRGGWGPSATIAYIRLASLISVKVSQPTLNWKLSSLTDFTVMCRQGAWSSFHHPSRGLNLQEQPLDPIASETQLSLWCCIPFHIIIVLFTIPYISLLCIKLYCMCTCVLYCKKIWSQPHLWNWSLVTVIFPRHIGWNDPGEARRKEEA